MATEAERESWNTDPDAAYAEAERRVEKARRKGATRLVLNGDDGNDSALRALSRLPPLNDLPAVTVVDLENTQVSDLQPLAALTTLQTLRLNSTQVSDLQPLAALANLHTLWLDNTQVSDLRPIAGLDALNEGAKRKGGLHYNGTPAVQSYPTLATLAVLDPRERTPQTLLYLKGEHPEYGGPPEPPGQSLNVGHNRIELVRIAAPSDFRLSEVEFVTKIDVQLDPIAPEPKRASLTPVNDEARTTLLHGVYAIAKEVDRSLAAYKVEGEESNRVEAARQIAGGARTIVRQTTKQGKDFTTPSVSPHRRIARGGMAGGCPRARSL